jgi:cellulose synthase/poly-beta-1,6-N-acetylglucosamine synthase-like glycosyltransferase
MKHTPERAAALGIAGTLPLPGAPDFGHAGVEPFEQPRRKTVHVPKPTLHIAIFGLWLSAILWFTPKLLPLLDLATGPGSFAALAFFVVFTQVAWLYASYNVCVIAFAMVYRWTKKPPAEVAITGIAPPVALLYTTCNDFVEQSLLSCLRQDYANFKLYILDDSSDPDYKRQVDRFAARHPEQVRVVRRADRRGFKAGNLNHGLTRAAITEPYFALVDADEILPRNFLSRLVPRMLAEPQCGFIQANHKSNPVNESKLARAMGPGIDSHWKWYQPLRNRYGFVMLLGHGALVRRQAWVEAGGFPELVSEDLAFALACREQGWHGRFAEDVTCYEDFPETVRAFRVRHMKWTRGTCEFLSRQMWQLLSSRTIPFVEKIDVLIPTINLPLSLLFFLFVVDTNFVIASLYGHQETLTVETGILPLTLGVMHLDPAFAILNRVDLFAITLLTLVAPVLCFIIDMWRTPVRLIRFLCQSTALYGALGPLSSLGVLMFSLTGKAVFHVTADRGSGTAAAEPQAGNLFSRWAEGVKRFMIRSHPDHWLVQSFEIACGLLFAWAALQSFQIAFFGLAFALLLFPILHHVRWENRVVQVLVMLPLLLVIAGLSVSGMALAGMQTVFFGFGFHF